MKTAIRCLSLFWLFVLVPAALAADPEKIAAAVPVEVAEVVNGGTWSEDGKTGFYRAIIVTPGQGAPVSVVVQLLSLENENAVPKVSKTVLIKEVTDHAFPNAFLAMDAETDNEMTLIVTSYGSASDQDTAIHFKFDGKGNYEILAAPGDEAEAGKENASKN